MIIDLFLFFYCSSVLLSFSIFLFDGYLAFCLIWIFSLFYSTSSNLTALPTFVRLIWFLFFSSMLLGRFAYFLLSRRKSFPKLKPYSTSTFSPQFHGTIHQLSIKPAIFYYFIFASLVLLFLSISGIGQNTEFAGVNAASKSRIPYIFNGLLTTLLSYWTFSILLASRSIPSSIVSQFLDKVLPFSVIAKFAGVLKFSAFLASYATKFIVPLFDYLLLRYYMAFPWITIKISLSRLKLSKKLLIFSLSVLTLLFTSTFLLSLANLDLLDLIIYKIIVRSDSYGLLDLNSLRLLSHEYAGNLFYFLHPFLKTIGLQAYDMPMGSFLISAGSNINQIGGPNIHLPVVLFVLGGLGFWGFVFIIFFGTLFSVALCFARANIISYVNGPNDQSTLFWPIFFFNLFPLLLQEPSAFGHGLFFAVFVYLFLRLLTPSLLRVFAKSSTNPL